MTSIETIALIFIVFAIIKFVVLAINPGSWYGKSNPLVNIMTKSPIAAYVISIIFGGLVLFYLLKELSIIQIFAATVFSWFLMMLTFGPFFREIIGSVKGMAEQKPHFFCRFWFPLVVWIVLMAWVVWEIFI